MSSHAESKLDIRPIQRPSARQWKDSSTEPSEGASSLPFEERALSVWPSRH